MHRKKHILSIFFLAFLLGHISSCKEDRNNSTTSHSSKSIVKPTSATVIKPTTASVSSGEDKTMDSINAQISSTSIVHEENNTTNGKIEVETAKEPIKTKKKPKRKPRRKNKKTTHSLKPIPVVLPRKETAPKFSAKITFEELTWNFGKITEGDIVEKKFKFTNTGNAPLEILATSATCGCTRPSFPFLLIAPGKSDVIGVQYNSVNKDGDQDPVVTIESNTIPKITTIKLFGTVKPKSKEQITKEKIEKEEKRKLAMEKEDNKKKKEKQKTMTLDSNISIVDTTIAKKN